MLKLKSFALHKKHSLNLLKSSLKIAPFTFKVSDVQAETVENFKEFSPHEILPNLKNIPENETCKKTYVTKPIQSSFNSSTDSIFFQSNSFVLSGVTAYSRHHDWIIKPDDVWLAISTQLSFYLNSQSEELRSKFVDFNGTKELVVTGGENMQNANYHSLCLEMSKEIAKNIKDPSVREWIIPNFTTTTDMDRMVGSIILMASMKKYFDYKFFLLCSLPSVTLEGETKDWIELREKANKLLEFDNEEQYMMKWSKLLFPVLDQFVESSKGNPNKEWWNRVGHVKGGASVNPFLSGWITSFCVFSEEGSWRGDHFTNEVTTSEWPLVDTNEIPRGYVNVPIKVQDLFGNVMQTEMFAGHFVSEKLEDGKSIRPRVDWALFEVLEK